GAVRARAEQDYPERQGERGAGPDRGVPRHGFTLRLSAAFGADGGGPRQQGDRGDDRGAGGAAAVRDRRHDPCVVDAAAEWGSHRRGDRLAADSAVARNPEFYAAGDGVPRLRADDQHVLPGDGGPDPELSAGADARVERA